jgi:hypothetical protein
MFQKAVKTPVQITDFSLYYVLVQDVYIPAPEMHVVGDPMFFVLK